MIRGNTGSNPSSKFLLECPCLHAGAPWLFFMTLNLYPRIQGFQSPGPHKPMKGYLCICAIYNFICV